MLTKRLMVVGLAAGAIGLLACRASLAQDGKPDRAPPPGGGNAERSKPAPGPQDSEDAKPGRPDDWGPPPGPPRGKDRRRPEPGGADDDRPRPKPPREDAFDRPPPRDDDGRRGPDHSPGHKPPRDDDADRPPSRDRDGGPGPERRPPPPRWPYQDWASMEKKDPEMFKILKQEIDLDHQTKDLVDDYRQAPASKRGDLKTQVEKLVDQQFEVRQQRRQLELKRFEEELQRLRDAIEKRSKARKQIVEKRVVELLGQEEDVGF